MTLVHETSMPPHLNPFHGSISAYPPYVPSTLSSRAPLSSSLSSAPVFGFGGGYAGFNLGSRNLSAQPLAYGGHHASSSVDLERDRQRFDRELKRGRPGTMEKVAVEEYRERSISRASSRQSLGRSSPPPDYSPAGVLPRPSISPELKLELDSSASCSPLHQRESYDHLRRGPSLSRGPSSSRGYPADSYDISSHPASLGLPEPAPRASPVTLAGLPTPEASARLAPAKRNTSRTVSEERLLRRQVSRDLKQDQDFQAELANLELRSLAAVLKESKAERVKEEVCDRTRVEEVGRQELSEVRVEDVQMRTSEDDVGRLGDEKSPSSSNDSAFDLSDSLAYATVIAINSIWNFNVPNSHLAPVARESESSSQMPLEAFVRETVRRSRTVPQVHQLALYYIHRTRKTIHARVIETMQARDRLRRINIRKEDLTPYPSPPASPETQLRHPEEVTLLLRRSQDPVRCGRRTFIAALIVASKFLQDRNYSNRAWAKITGLKVEEINYHERNFLNLIDYKLVVHPKDFSTWQDRLIKLVNDSKNPKSTPQTPPTGCLQSAELLRTRNGFQRSSSEYLPSPSTINPRASFYDNQTLTPSRERELGRSSTVPENNAHSSSQSYPLSYGSRLGDSLSTSHTHQALPVTRSPDQRMVLPEQSRFSRERRSSLSRPAGHLRVRSLRHSLSRSSLSGDHHALAGLDDGVRVPQMSFDERFPWYSETRGILQ